MRFIIDEKTAYNFHDYFNLNPPIKDLLTYFGYGYQRQNYNLPRQTSLDLTPFTHLKQQVKRNLERVNLSSETARREALIAPVILEVAGYLGIDVEIEYPLAVSDQLKGKLDYFLRTEQILLVIEANKGDLARGFITMGNVWQFGILHRDNKQVVQDLAIYRVPADLDDLLPILVGILVNE